jgi:hypothetical protein
VSGKATTADLSDWWVLLYLLTGRNVFGGGGGGQFYDNIAKVAIIHNKKM